MARLILMQKYDVATFTLQETTSQPGYQILPVQTDYTNH